MGKCRQSAEGLSSSEREIDLQVGPLDGRRQIHTASRTKRLQVSTNRTPSLATSIQHIVYRTAARNSLDVKKSSSINLPLCQALEDLMPGK